MSTNIRHNITNSCDFSIRENKIREIIMESDKENRYREPIYKEIIDVEYVSKIEPL